MDESHPIKVLVVDGSALYRKAISEAVAATPGMTLSGTAPTGDIALRSLGIEDVDMVLLDAGTAGSETVKRIRAEFPDVSIVMISGNSEEEARTTIRALASGAVDLVPKPERGSMTAGMDKVQKGLAELAELMGMHRGPAEAAAAFTVPSPTRKFLRRMGGNDAEGKERRFELVLIGVSAGGPRALERVIPRLSPDLPVPVLVVQHMPPHFTHSLAEYLRERSGIRVREAEDGQGLAEGTVLIAPGGRHMVVEPGAEDTFCVRLDDGPPVNSCRPSIDVLCGSVARCMRRPVLAVVLTGMGDDGARGVEMLKRRGSYCIAQTEQTCTVYGMPRAVAERGLADETADLDKVADRITELTGRNG